MWTPLIWGHQFTVTFALLQKQLSSTVRSLDPACQFSWVFAGPFREQCFVIRAVQGPDYAAIIGSAVWTSNQICLLVFELRTRWTVLWTSVDCHAISNWWCSGWVSAVEWRFHVVLLFNCHRVGIFAVLCAVRFHRYFGSCLVCACVECAIVKKK